MFQTQLTSVCCRSLAAGAGGSHEQWKVLKVLAAVPEDGGMERSEREGGRVRERDGKKREREREQ